jgi:signal transduction histidine kinase
VAPTLAGWAIGLLVTGAILGTPYLLFAYHSPELHLVLDCIDSGIALLVAYLVFGRYSRSGRLQDLLLADGLFLLGIAGVGLTLALHLLGVDDERIGVWLPVALRLLGAVLIVTASLVGGRLARVGHGLGWIAPWVAVVAAAALAWAWRGVLPAALSETPPASAQHPVITGHPALLWAHGLTALCFAVASVLFARRGRQEREAADELIWVLGPAFALAAFARLNYLLFPSLYSDWLYTGDLLRTACYVVLLLGAAREISHYWTAQARAAVLDDRRRLARELHDGVVQELSYIRLETFLVDSDPTARERIVDACDRALDEARAAVDALGRSADEPLGFVLHRAARQVAERYHATLEVELDDSVHADAEERHALVRITREAVSNAIRHGRAQRIHLCLARDEDRRRLLVEDDGAGFDPLAARTQSTGYGLTSMEERARGLHASFVIDSAPGRGTTVAVTW